MTTQTTSATKTTKTIIALVAALVFIVSSFGFAAANADTTGYLTGSTWFDANANGMHELDENAAPNTAIYLRAVGSNVAVAGGLVIFSDANGYFDFGSVDFGTYQLQAENGDMVEITLSEVNGTVSVELPVIVDDAPAAANGESYQIFLPLVIR